MLGDRLDETLDLLLDAGDLLVEELELLVRGLALSDLGAQPLLDVAVGGAGSQPFRPLGKPLLARLALERVLECPQDRPQRLKRVELLAHLWMVTLMLRWSGSTAQLADPIGFSSRMNRHANSVAVWFWFSVIAFRAFCRAAVLLKGQMREQMAMYSRTYSPMVAMIDELSARAPRRSARARRPTGRGSGGLLTSTKSSAFRTLPTATKRPSTVSLLSASSARPIVTGGRTPGILKPSDVGAGLVAAGLVPPSTQAVPGHAAPRTHAPFLPLQRH